MAAPHWNSDDPICYACIGSPSLKQYAKCNGRRRRCANCGRNRTSIEFDDLATRVDEVYRELYRPGGNTEFGESGDYPEEIIRELLQDHGTDIPEALVAYLSQGEWRDISKGADAFYDSGSRYVEVDLATNPWELSYAWSEFAERVRFGRRFFDLQLRTSLDELLAIIRDVDTARLGSAPLIYPLKRGTEIYRAREATTFAEVQTIQKSPAKELGSAPRVARMKGGRMNAPGISTFYGAFDSATCIAEMKPSVGSMVVWGRFKLIRPATILDLTRLDVRIAPGEPFEGGYFDRVRHLRFLRTFHNIVSQPVHPAKESIDYVPTQVVADYLANVGEIEGVIFRSAQFGRPVDEHGSLTSAHNNVAFFNSEAIVKERSRRTTPQVAKKDIHLPVPTFTERQQPLLRFVVGSLEGAKITAAAPQWSKMYLFSDFGLTPEDLDDMG